LIIKAAKAVLNTKQSCNNKKKSLLSWKKAFLVI